MNYYIYKITFVDGDYYYGSRGSIVSPEEDVYWGTPVTHKDKWRTTMFSKEIVGVFKTSKEMLQEENKLIKPVYKTDPHCLNENCGGRINYTSEIRQKMSESMQGKNKGKVHSEEARQKISETMRTKAMTKTMFYRVILLRIFEDGRISNQTSIHPTEDNACHYAKGALLTGSADGFVVIEEHKDEWTVVCEHLDVTRYNVTLRQGMFRIERTQQLTLV